MTNGFRKGGLGLSLALGLSAGMVHASAPDQTWARTYNPQGLVATIDGPRTDVSDITQYQYDTQGHLSTVTDALGHVTTYGNYDSYSNPLQIIDANGVVTTLTYTPQEWPLTITRDSSGTPSTTTLTYDAAGDLTQTQDADGVTLIYTYDSARRLTDITDGAGNRIHYTLDAAGNRTQEQTFDPSNTLTHTVSRTFNNLSQLLTVVDALNRTVLTYSYPDGYDAAGHPKHSADAAGTQRTLGYDALDRLVSTIDNANGTDTATQNTQTTSSYDSSDNLTSVVDPSSLTTSYTYDGLGHRTGLQSPDTGASADTYDAAGNQLTHTDAKGITRTMGYDALNRLISTTFADSTLNITYAYDESNSVTGCTNSAPIGRLTRIVENAVTTAYCYDARGEVIQKRQVTSAATDVTSYTYSLAGRLRQQTNPDGTSILDTYNALGQLSGVQVTPVGGSASVVVSNISYLPFGPISGYTLGNGQTVTRTYDATYALTDLTSPALTLHFARDPLGRITAEGNAPGASPATETYHYDALSRLGEVDDANGSLIQSYTYNQTGDRLTKNGNALATGNYGYTTGTHQINSIGSSARASDANGNTTGISSAGQAFGYGYNGRNRLTVVQVAGSTVGTYSYNALGQRIGKAATLPNAITQRFVYNEQGSLIGEYGTNTRDYVWMGDTPVAVIDVAGSTSTINYVTADQLGTPRAVSDSSGATIWSWAWVGNPYGELSPTSTAGYTLNLRYPGQYYDNESGLMDNINRSYDPATGRYIQSDPIGLAGGISTYAYVGDQPLSNVDPQGLACPADLMAAGTCFQSSNYDQNSSDDTTVAGTAETDEVAMLNMRKLDTSETDENYAVITDTDTFVTTSGQGINTTKGYQGTFLIDGSKTQAICHSHRLSKGYWPTPGYEDNDPIVNNNQPNYIVRNGVIGVLEEVDGQYQYRLLKGRLTGPQIHATQQQLNLYQKH